MGIIDEIEEIGGNIVEGFEDFIGGVGDVLTGDFSGFEDILKGTLNIMTFGTFDYAKDALFDFVAPEPPERTYKDRKRTVRQAVASRQVIYGTIRTGGQLIYIAEDGKDNIELWMCFVVAGHACNSIAEVYVDDILMFTDAGSRSSMTRDTSTKFDSNIFAWAVYDGLGAAFIPSINITSSNSAYEETGSQPPDWTSNHKLTGQSYVWIHMVYEKDVFQGSGIPKFEFVVEGKDDLYDPRDGQNKFSDNAGLALLDVLLWDRMFDLSQSEVDLTAFGDLADICDELVDSDQVGGTEKRYTCNGSFKLQIPPLELIQSVAKASASTVYYSQGVWSVSPGAYEAPIMTLDEDDLIGGVTFQPGPPKSRRVNTARGTYVDPNENYDLVGFQELQISAYVTEDGEVLDKDYEFPWTNSPTMARRLAKIDIERNRFGVSCEITTKFAASSGDSPLELTPGDRINFQIDALGWTPKVFRVEAVDVSFREGVTLQLREDDSAIYDWEPGDALALDSPPTLSIPNAGIGMSAITGITFTEEIVEGVDREKRARLIVSWNENPSAIEYNVRYKLSADSTFLTVAERLRDTSVVINDLVDAQYDVEIQGVSESGNVGPWTAASYTIEGEVATLAAAISLTELAYKPAHPDAIFSTIVVDLDPPADPDYSHSIVEYQKQGYPGWFRVGPTGVNDSVEFVVLSDGATFDVRAFSVSNTGVRSGNSVSASITVSNSLDETQGDIGAHVPAPLVNGLELFEQANSTEFAGRDAKFVWRKTTVEQWYEIGSEGQLGAAAGALDQYFKDYQVEIWAGSPLDLVRTEFVVDPQYIYTYEKNAEDYQRINGSVGVWRTFEIRVYNRGRLNQLSTRPAKLAVSNPAPGLPTNLTVSPGFRILRVSFDPPQDLDYQETRIYVGTSTGFDYTTVDPVIGYKGPILVEELDDDTTYYVRLATFDAYGQGTLSSEFTIQTLDIPDVFSPWADVTAKDRAFIDANLENDAIDTTKIVKLTASKIVTGTLAATESISVEGTVESTVGSYTATLGPVDYSGTVALLSFDVSGTPIFAAFENGDVQLNSNATVFQDGSLDFGNGDFTMDAAGNVTFSGDLSAAGGTFSGTLSGGIVEGSVVRTSSSGARVEINDTNNSLRIYDSGGNVLLRLGPNADGDFDAGLSTNNDPADPHLNKGADLNGDDYGVFATVLTNTGTAGVYGFGNEDVPGIKGEGDFGTGFTSIGVFGRGDRGVQGEAYDDTLGYDFYALGSNANYGPFTGAHDGLIRIEHYPEPGDIMRVVRLVHRRSLSQTIHELEQATKARGKDFFGVYVGQMRPGNKNRPSALKGMPGKEYEALRERFDLCVVNGLGEGAINVCDQGGDIQVGDFLSTSNTPGKGMRYAGNDGRLVVAKAMEPVTWADEPETVKQIACIYMCG